MAISWKNGKTLWMVATNPFGMGIHYKAVLTPPRCSSSAIVFYIAPIVIDRTLKSKYIHQSSLPLGLACSHAPKFKAGYYVCIYSYDMVPK